MSSSLEIIVSLVEIFLLYFNLGYFIEGTRLKKLVIAHPDDLLKIKNGVIVVVELLQCLCLVEIGLA
jgi:hypothetical protein